MKEKKDLPNYSIAVLLIGAFGSFVSNVLWWEWITRR
jgi:hypothetical protein